MDLTKYTMNNRLVSMVIVTFLIIGGIKSYGNLGRLEDPAFTIKQSVIITRYPGASAKEVEKEVTDRLETAVQQMKQLDKVWSISRPGISVIYVEMKDIYDKSTLPQVWDELRNKIGDVQGRLPSGATTPVVQDDFGDVFGVFFALHGKGYTLKELYEYAKLLRRELLLCENVAKIDLLGYDSEAIYLEMSRAKLYQLGISAENIVAAINQQNTVTTAGNADYDGQYIRIKSTGSFADYKQIGDMLIRGTEPGNLIRIKDVAVVKKGYIEPAQSILEFNDQPAIGIGISTIPGTNVILMGDAVKKRLAELMPQTPPGMELGIISYQSQAVEEAVSGFVVNLVEAVIIVVVLLLIFMGKHEGVIIGLILLLTILVTFILMDLFSINLQRISLGALIIALGMLVDNAIVVAEGIVVKMQRGLDKEAAAVEAVTETKWPLLGATFIAVLAFAAISLSNDSTGEFLGSLFQVIALSLLISWVLAITVTPLLCTMLITKKDATEKDPHDNRFFRMYGVVLRWCINHRWSVLVSMFVLFLVSGYCFKFTSKEFFPASSRAQFLIDVWTREGGHIDQTNKALESIAKELREDKDNISDVTTMAGRGTLRFLLTYSPEMSNPAYGQLIVDVHDWNKIDDIISKLTKQLAVNYPQMQFNIKKFQLGPSTGSKIEARFLGPDVEVLRDLAEQAKAVMYRIQKEKGIVKFIHDDWRQPVQSLDVAIAESRARNAGISRPDINQTIATNFSGTTIGVFRENDELVPIIARPPQKDRGDINEIHNLQVWSPKHLTNIPIGQVIDGVRLSWEENNIRRRNRQRCITAQCDPVGVTAADLQKIVGKEIEKIKLPDGYKLEWGGDHENSTRAQRKLMRNVPLAGILMFLITLFLFGTLRHPIIIFLGLPLAVIGVTWGLLLTGRPFGFMALLGFLSLSGMLIKNEIVLLDQINLEIASGKKKFTAIIEASISRVRPVSMAAFTTVLGMMPLFFDAFFGPMGVVIMAGLTFATVLTLIVTPVLYATLFRIKESDG